MTDVTQPQLDFTPPIAEAPVDPIQAAIERGRAAAEAVLALEKRPDLADATPSDEVRALYPDRRAVATDSNEEQPTDNGMTAYQKVMAQVADLRRRNTEAARSRGEEPVTSDDIGSMGRRTAARYLNGERIRYHQRGSHRG
jgi:hypothetical protein